MRRRRLHATLLHATLLHATLLHATLLHATLEPGKGIEPLTYALQVRCSAS